MSCTSLKFKTSALRKTVKRMRKQTRDWEKVFAKHIYDKGLNQNIQR